MLMCNWCAAQGCSKDLQRALHFKGQAAASFAKGNYAQAVQHYSGAYAVIAVTAYARLAAQLSN
jgi:hypothetical protein